MEYLEDDLKSTSGGKKYGTSSWYPSWIPLGLIAKPDSAEAARDSLFKNILNLEGARFENGNRQTLRRFFEIDDGAEPNGKDENGNQAFWECEDTKPPRPRCRKELYAIFGDLLTKHDAGERIISFTIQAAADPGGKKRDITETESFVAELNEQGTTNVIEGEGARASDREI